MDGKERKTNKKKRFPVQERSAKGIPNGKAEEKLIVKRANRKSNYSLSNLNRKSRLNNIYVLF